MRNKSIFYFVSLIVFFALVAGLAVFINNKDKSRFKELPVAEETKKGPGGILISTSLNEKLINPAIDIAIEPVKEPIEISAFALSINLMATEKPGLSSERELITNTELVDEGWVFPLKKTPEVSGNKIYVGLSGYHIGKSSFILNKKIIIASIPVKETALADGLKIEIDIENTKFLAGDALTEINATVTESQKLD